MNTIIRRNTYRSVNNFHTLRNLSLLRNTNKGISLDFKRNFNFTHYSLNNQKISNDSGNKAKKTQANELDLLVLPPPPSDYSTMKRWLHKGKTLVVFYFRGIKQILYNKQTVKEIKSRQNFESSLTHKEFQLLNNHNKDMKKLLPFAVLFILLEEIIPLIAYYFPQVLPSTVVLPSQKLHIKNSIENRRLNTLRQFRSDVNEESRRQLIKTLMDFNSNDISPFMKLKKLEPSHIIFLCQIFDLSTFGTINMNIRRIIKYLKYISDDDECILRDTVKELPTTEFLSEGEISDACSQRGL